VIISAAHLSKWTWSEGCHWH